MVFDGSEYFFWLLLVKISERMLPLHSLAKAKGAETNERNRKRKENK